MAEMQLEPWALTTLKIASIALGAVVAYLLVRTAIGAAVGHLLERRPPAVVVAEGRMRTLQRLALRVAASGISLIALLMVLSQVGIDVGPAVAGLGVVGIAVGFGAQTLIRDWLAGVFVVLENQYSAGDAVRIAGVEGIVEDFSLRRTTLRDADGTVHTVPNGQIIVASNLSRGGPRGGAGSGGGAGADDIAPGDEAESSAL
jgi:moderate conductance mechanosensitive channel